MAQSVFARKELRDRLVASVSSVAAGARTVLQLNKDHLIREHAVFIEGTATYAVAPTAVNTDLIGNVIQSAKLVVSGKKQGGRRFYMDGVMLPLVSAAFEDLPAAVYSLGTTTTFSFGFDIHHANDESRYDLLTALDGDAAASITLEIEFAPLASHLLAFTAGAAPTAATFDVYVQSREHDPAAYLASEDDKFAQIATLRHTQEQHDGNVAAAGVIDIELTPGNSTRALMIAVDDGAGAMSDTLVTELRFVVAGEERLVKRWAQLRRDTVKYHGMNVTGFIIHEFSPEEIGFLDLENVKTARVLMTATAAARARIVQDYTGES